MQSSLLRSLVTPGQGFPDPAEPLQKLLDSADWDAAASQGRICPCRVRVQAVMCGSCPAWLCQALQHRC